MSLTEAMDKHTIHDGLPVFREQKAQQVRYVAGNKVLIKQYECSICHKVITTRTVVSSLKKGKKDDSI